ncbi:DUF4280 domain-containing protein [Paenibacillus polymyxa]|uniref:DUF4280 domain-containing protein n=1 Tax=Paenibacillus polymyxa TaxID=1406 RepID=UPI002024613E|nr:DUF4280 domain-containing protein [Paenibacillus polymyxa]MDU8672558.1 DUF4280 domain-containing protein [Paenibacillus polymyxa]MDU8697465.1 DUF4280 domain-containing protein [Paenibacillus polymyxa]URJ56630.1 DUF4280 domain-containing protein [Paenibacillus polymyxa]URJ64060.1 DUF4280 domain-containing protein [Paenibacillus polymyxa]URJ71138.1 DUF4280 domain-containing protein [Paenibacillus polymyxa]
MSDRYIVDGAVVHCSCGSQSGVFRAAADRNIQINHKAQGNILDFQPHTNISSFGLCSSSSNPQVVSANKGNNSGLIPQPCRPSISMPWMNGKNNVYVGQAQALLSCSTNMCMWCGNIFFTTDGQE